MKYDRNIILVTKDILRQDYLSCYNDNAIFETKNIDALARKGTLFKNFTCSAPSSGMAVSCMFSGLHAHELNRKTFREVDDFNQVPTLFNILEASDIDTHVLWSKEFRKLAYLYSKVFDKNTTITYAPPGGSTKPIPQQHAFEGKIEYEYDLSDYYFKYLKNLNDTNEGLWFVWCHCPHIFYPAGGYGADIDVFDRFIGLLDKEINADLIISGDHGHMRGEKGKIAYGFDVYQPAIHLPLICPDYFGEKIIDFPTEQSQLKDLILEKKIEKQEFVYSDTKYYEQPGRKVMIRKNNYKLLFNKSDKSEELYDLTFDPSENINLLIKDWPDFDRNKSYALSHVIYYPDWEIAEEMYNDLSNELKRIWKKGSWYMELAHNLNYRRRAGFSSIFKNQPKTRVLKGRWGSRARYNY